MFLFGFLSFSYNPAIVNIHYKLSSPSLKLVFTTLFLIYILMQSISLCCFVYCTYFKKSFTTLRSYIFSYQDVVWSIKSHDLYNSLSNESAKEKFFYFKDKIYTYSKMLVLFFDLCRGGYLDVRCPFLSTFLNAWNSQ